MQQSVVGFCGVAVPVAVPSIAWHVPPFGGTVMVAFAEVMFGLPDNAAHVVVVESAVSKTDRPRPSQT
jgi:hypothetical protein